MFHKKYKALRFISSKQRRLSTASAAWSFISAAVIKLQEAKFVWKFEMLESSTVFYHMYMEL